MTENENKKNDQHLKKAWIIYTLLVLLVILVLVFFVAGDNEERFFFSLMPAAAAYVLRPSEALMKKQIAKFTGPAKDVDEK